jgi:hypothetical protein
MLLWVFFAITVLDLWWNNLQLITGSQLTIRYSLSKSPSSHAGTLCGTGGILIACPDAAMINLLDIKTKSSSALGLNFERVEDSVTPTHRALPGMIVEPLFHSVTDILIICFHFSFQSAFAPVIHHSFRLFVSAEDVLGLRDISFRPTLQL